jgi:hypothetical protein
MAFPLFTTKQYRERIAELEQQLKRQVEAKQLVVKNLARHLREANEERKALLLSLRTLAVQLHESERARDIMQRWGNDNLEEMRALRRLEKLVAEYVKEVGGDQPPNGQRTVFAPKIAAALRDVEEQRAKRGK